jgi:hypothetical protein
LFSVNCLGCTYNSTRLEQALLLLRPRNHTSTPKFGSTETRKDLWEKVGKSPGEVFQQPAFRKLLLFWWMVARLTEESLTRIANGRYMTLSLEEFARGPGENVQRVYEAIGWDCPSMTYEHVKPVRSGWRLDSEEWEKAFEWVGFPKALEDRSPFRGTVLAEQCAIRAMQRE